MAEDKIKMLINESEPSMFYDVFNISDVSSIVFFERSKLSRRSLSLNSISTPKNYDYNRSLYQLPTSLRKFSYDTKPSVFKEELKSKFSASAKEIAEDYETINFLEKYNEALKEIELLKLENSALKTKTTTPVMTYNSSWFKRSSLLRNSSSALRQNVCNRSSFYMADSTCFTDDIEDNLDNDSDDKIKKDNFFRDNSCSSCPLLENSSSKKTVKRFFTSCIKCSKLFSLKKNKRKMTLKVPDFLINSPKKSPSDSGHNSGQHFQSENFTPNQKSDMLKIINKIEKNCSILKNMATQPNFD